MLHLVMKKKYEVVEFFVYVVYLNYSRLLSPCTSTCVIINVVFLCLSIMIKKKNSLFGTSQFTNATLSPRCGLSGALDSVQC